MIQSVVRIFLRFQRKVSPEQYERMQMSTANYIICIVQEFLQESDAEKSLLFYGVERFFLM